MSYTAGIWKAWMALRHNLFLSPRGNDVPAHWWVEDVLHSLHLFSLMEESTIKNITLTLGKIGITKAGHLWDPVDNS